MKKTLILDLGNVILKVKKQVVIEKFAKILKVSVNQIEKQIDWNLEEIYESGNISTDDYINQINPNEKIFTYDNLIEIWKDGFEEIWTTVDLLPRLAKTTNLFMLSNTNDIHFTAIENRFKISCYFQKLVLSYQLGCRKPDHEIYHKALKIAETTPDNAYFVDDLTKNIKSAKEVGITAHQYTNHEAFYNFLQIHSLI